MNSRDDRAQGHYRSDLGTEALERQRLLAKELHACCGEWRNGPHHEACKHFVPDQAPAEIPGQETLL